MSPQADKPSNETPNYFTRVFDTPLRELMCGRIKPRGNFRRVIADSGFDVALQDALSNRIQQAVWGRGRRVRLAQRLVSICSDELNTGRETSELADLLRGATRRPHGESWNDYLSKLLSLELPEEVSHLLNQVVQPIQSRRLYTATYETLSARWAVSLREGVTVDEIREQFVDPDVVGDLVNQLQSENVSWTNDVPSEVTCMIYNLIKKSRLWPSEKRDVASELAEHFSSGINSGELPSSLLESFGDPNLAARLIRRAKLRCRPWYWQAWRQTVRMSMAVSACLLLVWLFLMARMSVKPTIAVDFVARFDERMHSIPTADRAWPTYRKGLMKLSPWPLNSGILYDVFLHGTDAERWPQARNIYQSNASSIQLFLEASTLPHLGFRFNDRQNDDWLSKDGLSPAELYDPSEPITRVLLPHSQDLGAISNLLYCGLLDAEQQGDDRRVVEMLKAMIRVSCHIADTSDYLVSKHIGRVRLIKAGNEFLRFVSSNSAKLSTEELNEFRVLFESAWHRTEGDLTSDAKFADDLVQRIYSDNGNGDGLVTHVGMELLCDKDRDAFMWMGTHDTQHPLEFISYSSADRNSQETLKFGLFSIPIASLIAPRNEMQAVIDSLQGKLSQDLSFAYWERNESTFDSAFNELLASEISRLKYAPAIIAFADKSNDYVARMRKHAAIQMNRRDSWFVAIALESYRRKHDVWPDTLENLVASRLLNELPVDQFDGKPLRYILDSDHQPILYSVGPDQKDDLAEKLFSKIGEADFESLTEIKGDWSLFPIE